MNDNDNEIIRAVLCEYNKILTVTPIYIPMTGSAESGILLSWLMPCFYDNGFGPLEIDDADIYSGTRLSERGIMKAKRKLAKTTFITMKHGHSTTVYSVDMEKYGEAMEKAAAEAREGRT